jgi:beta-phosphoglucomutase-like phosphatase (HAD superfamily)
MKSAIFDLDNTLYDSAQYYSGAFSEVAEYLAGKYTQSRKNIYAKLMRNWRENTSMYPHLSTITTEPWNCIQAHTQLWKS